MDRSWWLGSVLVGSLLVGWLVARGWVADGGGVMGGAMGAGEVPHGPQHYVHGVEKVRNYAQSARVILKAPPGWDPEELLL